MKKLPDVLGWTGTILIVAAYVLVSFSFLNTNTVIYQLMNIVGAFGIVISSWEEKDPQPIFLNIFWGLIALIALITIIIR